MKTKELCPAQLTRAIRANRGGSKISYTKPQSNTLSVKLLSFH